MPSASLSRMTAHTMGRRSGNASRRYRASAAAPAGLWAASSRTVPRPGTRTRSRRPGHATFESPRTTASAPTGMPVSASASSRRIAPAAFDR